MKSAEPPRLAPPHVPVELIWNHNLAQFLSELDDPYLAGGRLHDGPGIIWATDTGHGKPGWVLTRLALIQEVYLDYERFSSARRENTSAFMGDDWRMVPLEIDPPEHTHYRNILSPFFTPSAINQLDSFVRDICNSLITPFEDRGSCEFIADFAAKFPSYIILALLGMPKERLGQFLEWEKGLIRNSNHTTRAAASRAIFGYIEEFVDEQMRSPTTDMMKSVVQARVDGRPIARVDIIGICFLLYSAGLDTVLSTLGWVMRHLAMDPALQDRLRENPEDIAVAVEEFTRAFGVTTVTRGVAKDITFHGVAMRKGDEILLPSPLANRDPSAFENPHVIDINRRARHMTFGTGPHTCLGVHLAKREMKIVLEAFLSRFRNIRLPKGENYAYHTGTILGVDRLVLEWDRSAAERP